MANTGQFTWTVGGKQLQHMLSAKCGQRFKSKPIEMCHLRWRIDCSPHDGSDSNNASFKIFLTILDFPSSWSKLVVQRHIQLIQTRACSTTLSTYTREHKSGGWKSRSQLLRELKQLQMPQIDIRIKIRVLHIIEAHSHRSDRTIYRDISTPLQSLYALKFHLNETYELQLFKRAAYGKRFESAFDDKNDIFCMLCFPKGSRREYDGYVSLYLNLLQFPVWNAHKIRCSYSIKCVETSVQRTGTYTLHSNHTNPGFPKFCKFSELFDKHNHPNSRSITFRAEVNVLSLWDHKDQQIPISKWNCGLGGRKQLQYTQCLAAHHHNEMDAKLEEKWDEVVPGSQPYAQSQPHVQPQVVSQQAEAQPPQLYKRNVSAEQVKRWLTETVGLPQYIDLFLENGFDDMWTIVQTMDESDLDAMGIQKKKRGHCKKIMHIINSTRDEISVDLKNSYRKQSNIDALQNGGEDEYQVEGAHFVETEQ